MRKIAIFFPFIGCLFLLAMTALAQSVPDITQIATTIITPANVAALAPIREFDCGSGISHANLFALSADQHYIAKTCNGLAIYDMTDGQEVVALTGSDGTDEQPLRFLPDGRLLWMGRTYVPDPPDQYFVSTPENGIWTQRSAAFDEAIDLIMADGYQNTTSLLANNFARSGGLLASLAAARNPLNDGLLPGSFAISPDQSQVALLTYRANDALLEVIDMLSGEVLMGKPLDIDPTLIQAGNPQLWFSPSGNFVLGEICLEFSGFGFACEPGQTGIFWWDARTGEERVRWMLPRSDFNYTGIPEFSPAGDLLAVPTVGAVLFYEVNTGEIIHTLERHSAQINFSPDGTFLVVAGEPAVTVYAVP